MTKVRKHAVAAATFFAHVLKIDKYDATINVVFKKDLTEESGFLACAKHVNKRRVNITIDAHIHPDLLLQTVAHEMVHAKQYIKGELSVSKKGYCLWKNKTVDADLPYHKEPWEVEAMKKEAILAHRYVAFIQAAKS